MSLDPEYLPPGMQIEPVPTGFTAPLEPEPAEPDDGPMSEIEDHSAHIAPAAFAALTADDLFDDQPMQVRHPPPRPPSEMFYKLDARLQNLATTIVYVGVPMQPDGHRLTWDLWGPRKAKQGLELAPGVAGLMHMPFTQLMSEGPYVVGAIPERVDYRKRELSWAVMVNVGYGPDTSFRYRMLEERWWASWSPKEDGYLGVYTRTHGWRFIRVRLAEEPKTQFQLDPTANDNNFMQWDMSIVAPDPIWYKRHLVGRWSNITDNGDPPPSTPWNQLDQLIRDILLGLIPGFTHLVPGLHVGEGVISVMNRGSEPAHPVFIVSSPGRAWIQDGPAGRMVQCPLLTPRDGFTMIDTDPINRTATSATDPVDPIYMRMIRNSQLLDFLLHDVTSSTLPVWRRMTGFFQIPWPPKQVANIRVQHSNPNGSIVCLMPQKFGMGFA